MSEEQGTIPAETAAKLIKVTVRHLQRLVKDGWIKKTPAGNYTAVATVHGYIDYLKDEARRGMHTTSQSELQSEKAKILQLRRAHLSGTLMLVEEHVAIAEDATGALRTEMSTLPAEVMASPTREHIEGLIEKILANFAARLEKRAVDIETDGEPVKAVAETPARRVGREVPKIPARVRKARAA